MIQKQSLMSWMYIPDVGLIGDIQRPIHGHMENSLSRQQSVSCDSDDSDESAVSVA